MIKALFLACVPLLASAAELNGRWNLHLIRFGEEFAAARVEFKSDGTKFTGTLNELKLEGTLEGDRVQVKATRPDGDAWGTFEGRLAGGTIAGSVKQPEDAFEWKAERVRESKGPPTTHTFEPKEFHRVFSGTIPPALHINPGDTVRTTTVDAGGRDASGTR